LKIEPIINFIRNFKGGNMKKMGRNRQLFVGCLTIAVVAGVALSALAFGGYLTTFNSQYGTAGTKLDSCILCHGAGGPPNNPFGASYAANGHDFAAIEQLDSDGDGYTNLEEITAGTFPGDANDSPNAPPPGDVAAVPTEGTIGTEVVLTGSGFGVQKGKVVLGPVFAKVPRGGWTDTTISSAMTRPLPAETYDLIIYPRPFGSAPPIVLPSSFTVKDPELAPLPVDNGSPHTEITVTGRFFSTKKGRVYVEGLYKGQPKKQRSRVTYWFMNPTTGESELRFLVPKRLDPGTYPLTVVNKVGTASTTFTINP